MGLLPPRAREIFQNSWFCYISEIEIPLQAYSKYIDSSEELITEIRDNIKSEEKFNEKLSDDDICFSPNYDIDTEIIDFYHNSIFICLYAFLEKKMRKLCKSVENEQKITIDDMSGRWIYRYKKYLEKIVGVDFNNIEQEWGELDKLNKIRNILTHSEEEWSTQKLSKEMLINFIKLIGVFMKKIYYEQEK